MSNKLIKNDVKNKKKSSTKEGQSKTVKQVNDNSASIMKFIKNNKLGIGIVGGAILLVIIIVIIAKSVINKDTDDIIVAEPGSDKYEYTDITVEEDALLEEICYAEIKVQDYGDIVVALRPDYAPRTVTNFVNLVGEKFYDGLTFHRIMTGFMIQGGDPSHNGTGGSEDTIIGEFANNNIDNPLKHKRGVLSMARSLENDSASSQFFIMHKDSTSLDGNYAAFGYVVGADQDNPEKNEFFKSGMSIVDKICEDTPVTDNNGTVNFEDQPVITSIRMIKFVE